MTVCEKSKTEILRCELSRTAQQLRQWAVASINGGWSTHQVDPMRKKADEIDELLDRTK